MRIPACIKPASIKAVGISLGLAIVVNQASAAGLQPDNADSKSIMIVDAHIHHGFSQGDTGIKVQGFEYFTKRGVQVISFPLPVNRDKTNDLITVIKAEIDALGALSGSDQKPGVTQDPAELNNNPGFDHVSVFLGIEYFHGVFNGNPDNVRKYREMGVRSITIIDNEHDRFFVHDQLTDFGKQVISEMNEAGILVDISHVPPEYMIDVIEFSKAPVIASHSCAMTVSKNSASLSDAVLDALEANDGYVFTTFNRNDLFLAEESGDDGIERFIEHIVYLSKALGPDHVGIGSDYQANGKYVPHALNQKNTYRQIFHGLGDAGFTDSDIEMIMSGTFLEAMRVHDQHDGSLTISD